MIFKLQGVKPFLGLCFCMVICLGISGCNTSDSVPDVSNLDNSVSMQNNIDNTTNTTLPTNKKHNSWGDLHLNPSESAYIYI